MTAAQPLPLDLRSELGPLTSAQLGEVPVSTLFYGDNLDVLRKHFKDEVVDLVYLDPPFNSARNYNAIFRNKDNDEPEAQIHAFEDTWTWGPTAEKALRELRESTLAPVRLITLIEALRESLGTSDMMAYLAMMTPRLVELYRVLKLTGSLYLHCDPTASHYLKLVLDALFGPDRFRNEIIWRRTGSHTAPKSLARIHDTILCYGKTEDTYFCPQKRPYMRRHVEDRFTKDKQGRYKFTTGGNILTGPGIRHGESGMEWRGYNPSAKTRNWAIPGYLAQQMPPGFDKLGSIDKLEALYQAGLVEIIPGTEWPQPVRYLQPDDGEYLSDLWTYQPSTEGLVFGTEEGIDGDVAWMGPTDPDRLRFPTQKPTGLLNRIIRLSCPPDGVVLDPFCGCGTTIASAHSLKREWIGIDITHLAISLIQSRLNDTFPGIKFETKGLPADAASARKLADDDKWGFQEWAIGAVGARPLAMGKDGSVKKGLDRGRDGLILFTDNPKTNRSQKVIVQVKGGSTGSKDIRDLMGTLEQHKAVIGVLVCVDEPTKEMKIAAASAGVWHSDAWNQDYDKIQILTTNDIFAGIRPKHPGKRQTFSEAPVFVPAPKQAELFTGSLPLGPTGKRIKAQKSSGKSSQEDE